MKENSACLIVALTVFFGHSVFSENETSDDPTFQIIEGDFTWQEAKSDAEARGGRLAVLDTQEKTDSISDLLASFDGSLWIGLTDEVNEGEWKWINGEPLAYSNWWTNQPSNSGNVEHYAHINWKTRDTQRRWNDAKNDDNNTGPGTGNKNNQKGYLLEIPIDSDGDGLSDSVETNTGTYVSETNTGTDPNNADSDGDGAPDGLEITEGTDPQDANSYNSFSTGLVAYYPFNGNAKDETGNGHNGTNNNASLTFDRFGNASGSYAFNGTNSYIEVADSNDFTIQSVTISAFVKATTSGFRLITTNYGQGNPGGNQWYSFATSGANNLHIQIDDGSQAPNIKTSNNVTELDVWQHLVGQYDGSQKTLRLFIDGDLVKEEQINLNQTVNPTGNLFIGGYPFTQGSYLDFVGLIDDVRIYNRALTADEVRALYLIDSDGDGLSDIVETNTGVYVSETNTGTDPNKADTDGDGLSDSVETNTGVYVSETNTGTDPNKADTDGDGVSDGNDAFPVDSTESVDTDGDGTGNNADTDDDGDGVVDGADAFPLDSTKYEGVEFIKVVAGSLPESSWDGAQSVEMFYMGKTEVTWEKFQEVRDWAENVGYDIGTEGEGLGSNYPVTRVSWYVAVKWCNARSEYEGLDPVYKTGGSVYRDGNTVPTVDTTANGYRLPSEKEWEFAAQGGVATNGFTYSGSDDVDAVGWYRENSGDSTQVVATKQANELGIHDMSGNVFEWCFDEDVNLDARSDASPGFRIIRGGKWNNTAGSLRVKKRYSQTPASENSTFGFRVARSALFDTDGDGEPDANDAFPLDSTESVDTDGDGTGNNADDLPLDSTESVDTDGDGIGNNADTDDDGDGMPDEWETRYSLLKNEDDRTSDHDGDGVPAWMEYIAGTSPTDQASRLDVTVDMVDGKPHVSLDTVSGRSYEFLVTQDFQTYVVWHTQSGTGNSEELVFDMDSPEVEAEFGANPGKTFFFQVRIQLSD